MSTPIYGKVQPRDLPKLKSIISIFKKHQLQCGLHGTSLWNPNYKDIDLLVFSQKDNISNFAVAMRSIQKKFNAKLGEMKGNEEIGYDCELKIGKMVYHISYVVLL